MARHSGAIYAEGFESDDCGESYLIIIMFCKSTRPLEQEHCSSSLCPVHMGLICRLSQTYSLTQSVTLNATGLATGITLLASPASRHFSVSSSAVLKASRVTFAGGRVRSVGGSSAYGGSLHISGSASGSFTSCSFQNNTVFSSSTAAAGGAIYVTSGNSITMVDCTVRDNTVVAANDGRGGGMSISTATSLTLTRTRFIGNMVQVKPAWTYEWRDIHVVCVMMGYYGAWRGQ